MYKAWVTFWGGRAVQRRIPGRAAEWVIAAHELCACLALLSWGRRCVLGSKCVCIQHRSMLLCLLGPSLSFCARELGERQYLWHARVCGSAECHCPSASCCRLLPPVPPLCLQMSKIPLSSSAACPSHPVLHLRWCKWFCCSLCTLKCVVAHSLTSLMSLKAMSFGNITIKILYTLPLCLPKLVAVYIMN